MEAVARRQDLMGRRLRVEHVAQPRVGDHICYISDLRRFRTDYPGWAMTRSLEDILRELARSG